MQVTWYDFFLLIFGCNVNFSLYSSAALRKQHAAELHLGDFLVFLRRVVSSKAIQSKMASPKWTEVLLNIASQKCSSGIRLLPYFRVFLYITCILFR